MDGDKREGNGGHSTKAKNPNDKRLNTHKGLLDKYVKDDFSYAKLKTLMDKIYTDALAGNHKAGSLFLSYVFGKPRETVETIHDFPQGSVTIRSTGDTPSVKDNL